MGIGSTHVKVGSVEREIRERVKFFSIEESPIAYFFVAPIELQVV